MGTTENNDALAAQEAEVREEIQKAKLRRAAGLSFLYLTNRTPLQALPTQIGLLDWMVWLDLEGSQVSDLTPIATLTRLEKLDLRCTDVVDLQPLAGMTALQSLFLEGTPVADLTPLAGLPRLRDLWLNGTQVTDLSPLAGCTGLRQLSLRGTGVHDLAPLAGLPELADLDITGTQVEDLTPLLRLPAFCEGVGEGMVAISFADTPAVARSKALARIATDEDDPARRAEDLLDHLTGGARGAGWRGDA